MVRTNVTDTPKDHRRKKRPIWPESGGRLAGGSGSSPPLRWWRILSKQGMECTPVFHNLFPHSSPLHIYKQRPKEEKEKKREEEKCTGALEICQGKAMLVEQKGKENEL